MAAYLLFVFYVILVLLVARMGRDSRLGYAGSAILGVLITPPILALLLYGLSPRNPNLPTVYEDDGRASR
ncbi:hypothetical protein [Breoghania sp. L-A4]|uniref:hypothetical protein n=1 Tax=Breoghania sp. L-A4 TaxID=2304600 RepID=UPI000E357F36|nr:hypothetical protein [Breoghania sp. L-A4]AXS40807.1 hypothetical protein D1F64_13035 [Breoghania sp. L-A4]